MVYHKSPALIREIIQNTRLPEHIPDEIIQQIFEFHVKQANTAGATKAASYFWLAVAFTGGHGAPQNREKGQEMMLEAAKLGHSQAQTNWVMRCLRDGCEKQVDQVTFRSWQLEAIVGDLVFENILPIDRADHQDLRDRLLKGFQQAMEGQNGNDLDPVHTQSFLLHAMRSKLPETAICDLENRQWRILKEIPARTVSEFIHSFGCKPCMAGLDMLHQLALFGNDHAVTDLVSHEDVDVDKTCQGPTEFADMTPLQIAFLRQNRRVLFALIDLAANVSALFEDKILFNTIRFGSRWSLHFLNHLIPLMEETPRKRAEQVFADAIVGEEGQHTGLQTAIVYDNWQT